MGKHKTAFTSVLSWHECLKKGLPLKEKQRVTQYLTEERTPKTSRQISNDLGIERTNITRSLNSLVELGIVEVKYYAPCKITGSKCGYYGVVEPLNTATDD